MPMTRFPRAALDYAPKGRRDRGQPGKGCTWQLKIYRRKINVLINEINHFLCIFVYLISTTQRKQFFKGYVPASLSKMSIHIITITLITLFEKVCIYASKLAGKKSSRNYG